MGLFHRSRKKENANRTTTSTAQTPGLPRQPGVTIHNADLAAAAKAILNGSGGANGNAPPPQDWLNGILAGVWPEVALYIEQEIVKSTLEPLIQASVPSMLAGIQFTEVSLGPVPPRLDNPLIACYEKKTVDLSFDLSFDGSLAVVKLGGSRLPSLGVRKLDFSARLGITFAPLLDEAPLIGTISVFFVDIPEVDLDLTGVLNVLDMPGLSRTIRGIIKYSIASAMVLPNRLVFQIADEKVVSPHMLLRIQAKPPEGVLRLHVIRAHNLRKADISLFGKGGASDPYCSLQVAGMKKRTHRIDNNLNPVWDETHTFVMSSLEQTVCIKVRDYDRLGTNDLLGTLRLPVRDLLRFGSDRAIPFVLDDDGHAARKASSPKYKGKGGVKQPYIVLSSTWLHKTMYTDVVNFDQDIVQILFLNIRHLIPDTSSMGHHQSDNNSNTNGAPVANGLSKKNGVPVAGPLKPPCKQMLELVVLVGKEKHNVWTGEITNDSMDVLQGANMLIDNANLPSIRVELRTFAVGTSATKATLLGACELRDYAVGEHLLSSVPTFPSKVVMDLSLTRWVLTRKGEGETPMPSSSNTGGGQQQQQQKQEEQEKQQLAITEPVDPKKLTAMSPRGLEKFQQATQRGEGDLEMRQLTMQSDWVNDYLVYLWPGVCVMVEDLLKHTVGPSIQDALPASMRGSLHVGFANAFLGDRPFRLDNFSVVRGQRNELDLHVDVSIHTADSTNISVVAKLFGGGAKSPVAETAATGDVDDGDKSGGDSWWRFASPSFWMSKVLGESGLSVSAGVKDVSFLARVGVSLRPLMPSGPTPIGGLAVYLLNSPFLDADMTGVADVLDWPMIDKAIRSAIISQIRNALVLPNRIFVPLVEDESMAEAMDLLSVHSANVAGVLMIRLIKAHKLRSADMFSASDPYCLLELGSRQIRTETIDNSDDPEWTEPESGGFLIVNDVQQLLDVSVFDADPVSFDDLLARFVQPISDIVDVLNSTTPAGDFARPSLTEAAAAVVSVNDRNDDEESGQGQQHQQQKLKKDNVERKDIEPCLGCPTSWAQGHLTSNSRYIRLQLHDADAKPNAPTSALDFEATWLVGESFVGGTLRSDWDRVAPTATMVQVLVKQLSSVVGVKPGATATPLPSPESDTNDTNNTYNTAASAVAADPTSTTAAAPVKKGTLANSHAVLNAAQHGTLTKEVPTPAPISYCFFAVDIASTPTATANGTALPAASSSGKASAGGGQVQLTSAIAIDPAADVFPNIDQVFAFVVPGVASDKAKVTLTYSKTGKVSNSLVVDKKTAESTGVLRLNAAIGEMQVLELSGGEVAYVIVKRTPLTPSIGPPPKPQGLQDGSSGDSTKKDVSHCGGGGGEGRGKPRHHSRRFSFLSALSCTGESASVGGVVEPGRRRSEPHNTTGSKGVAETVEMTAAARLTDMQQKQQQKVDSDDSNDVSY